MSDINTPRESKYAAYTLLASYWYHRAYEGLPDIWNGELTGTRKLSASIARFYDRLAWQQNPDAYDHAKYHAVYAIWRNHAYSFDVLRMILHFQGIVL